MLPLDSADWFDEPFLATWTRAGAVIYSYGEGCEVILKCFYENVYAWELRQYS
jgi:hypothetical protein